MRNIEENGDTERGYLWMWRSLVVFSSTCGCCRPETLNDLLKNGCERWKEGTERATRRGLINRRRERRQASLYYSLLQRNRERDRRVWRAELEIKRKTGEWREEEEGKRWEDIFIWHSLSLLSYFESLMDSCMLRVYVCHTEEMFNIYTYRANYRAVSGRGVSEPLIKAGTKTINKY